MVIAPGHQKINITDTNYLYQILSELTNNGKNFLIEGIICGDRVRIARALHKPPLTQGDLARKLNLMGVEMTTLIVSRIEKNQRHVCDGELLALMKSKHFGAYEKKILYWIQKSSKS